MGNIHKYEMELLNVINANCVNFSTWLDSNFWLYIDRSAFFKTDLFALWSACECKLSHTSGDLARHD